MMSRAPTVSYSFLPEHLVRPSVSGEGIPSHDLVMEEGCSFMLHLSVSLDASTSFAGHVPPSRVASLPQKDLSCLPGVGS